MMIETIEIYEYNWDKDIEEKIKVKVIGKVRYIGETFGALSLTNNKEYFVIESKKGCVLSMPLIVDDSGEAFCYDPVNPAPLDGTSKGGKWEILEDPFGELKKLKMY